MDPEQEHDPTRWFDESEVLTIGGGWGDALLRATVRTRTPYLMLALGRGEFLSLLRTAPELRARVEEVAEIRRAAQASFR
jgi:hypothetical protein